MEKILIVINGKGGVGKDTLCDLAAGHFRCRNISSVTPIKEIAKAGGWKGEKDAKARKMLSDLKKVFTEYNELPTRYICDQYEDFLKTDEEILFVHIREPKEIDKLKAALPGKCKALLITRKSYHQDWGNSSDDNVEDYDYDLHYKNDLPLREAGDDFIRFLHENLE